MTRIDRAEASGLEIRCKNSFVTAEHDRYGEMGCYFISKNPQGHTVEVATGKTYYCPGDEASFPVRKVLSTHATRLDAINAAKALCADKFLQREEWGY